MWNNHESLKRDRITHLVSFDGGHQLVIVCVLLGDDIWDDGGDDDDLLGAEPNACRQRVIGKSLLTQKRNVGLDCREVNILKSFLTEQSHKLIQGVLGHVLAVVLNHFFTTFGRRYKSKPTKERTTCWTVDHKS